MKNRRMNRGPVMAAIVLAGSFGASGIDPATFGFSPTASASANAVALQKALEGGNRDVTVTQPGTYDLDRTIYLDSNTRLVFAEGVTLRKAARYANVFANRGAFFGYANTNITIRGMTLSVNKQEAAPPPGSPAQGLRGQVGFYRVQNVRVEDFRCEDLGYSQYCIHFVDFADVAVERFTIKGKKDGVHLNCGRGFLVRDGVLLVGDDAVAVNAGEWPGGCTPRIGSVENGVIEKLHILPGTNGNIARVITGSWKEWHPGMRLQRNDIVRRGEHVYAIFPMPLGTNEIVSLTGPTHTSGVWKSPEGINFQYMQSDGCSRADIRNVVIRDVFNEGNYGIVCGWEVNSPWARLVHPEIPPADYPSIDLTVDHVTMDSPRAGAPLLRGGAPATVRLNNVENRTGPIMSMSTVRNYPGIRQTLICTGSVLGRSPEEDFAFISGLCDVDLTISGCLAVRPVRISSLPGSSVRVHTRDEISLDHRKLTDERRQALQGKWL